MINPSNEVIDIETGKLSNTDIKKIINNLSYIEQKEIFKILKMHDEIYSINTNGIFFNLSNIGENTKKDIVRFLLFCKKNEKTLNKDKNDREEYKKLL